MIGMLRRASIDIDINRINSAGERDPSKQIAVLKAYVKADFSWLADDFSPIK